MICKSFDVTIRGDNDPIKAEVRAAGLQFLKLDGNTLSISDGNSVVLPSGGGAVDLSDVNKRIEGLANQIASLPAPLSEQAIQALINKALPDLTPLQEEIQKTKSEFFEEVDMANKNIQKIKTTMLTETKVQSLIDTAINAITDSEGVRY